MRSGVEVGMRGGLGRGRGRLLGGHEGRAGEGGRYQGRQGGGRAHDTEVTREGEGLTYMTFHHIILRYTLFVRMTYKHDITTSSNHKSQFTIPIG